MRLRQLLLQEIIRAIALGWVVFLFLALIHESLGLSARQVMTLSGLSTLGIFLTFTAIRLRTGRELMARTKRDWTIMGVVGAVLLATYTGVAVIVGQERTALKFGLWRVMISAVGLILFTWLGYRNSMRHR
jgi:hypothetical protein